MAFLDASGSKGIAARPTFHLTIPLLEQVYLAAIPNTLGVLVPVTNIFESYAVTHGYTARYSKDYTAWME